MKYALSASLTMRIIMIKKLPRAYNTLSHTMLP